MIFFFHFSDYFVCSEGHDLLASYITMLFSNVLWFFSFLERSTPSFLHSLQVTQGGIGLYKWSMALFSVVPVIKNYKFFFHFATYRFIIFLKLFHMYFCIILKLLVRKVKTLCQFKFRENIQNYDTNLDKHLLVKSTQKFDQYIRKDDIECIFTCSKNTQCLKSRFNS